MECQTFTNEKNWRSQNFNFLGEEIWRNALVLKSKKVQGKFGEMFSLVLSSSAVFRLQSQISFNLFCLGDKRLLSELLKKWDWFHGHNEHFPNIFTKS